MPSTELRERLARIPDVVVPVDPAVAPAIEATVTYLASDAALLSLQTDPYWPKWDSPWWHMLLLFEIGEARRIPARSVRAMVNALDAMPVKIFPIEPADIPDGIDPARETSCHCALGCMTQALDACGVDLARELPWTLPWFSRYQMADGGLTCDGDAYRVQDECPSSMVGSVAPLEALLLGDPKAWSQEHAAAADRAAAFFMARELRKGSPTKYNAAEREREPEWLRPCFPRFYLYDVLRGAHALVRWAALRGRSIPHAAVEVVAEHLCAEFPDGIVRVQRHASDGIMTRALDAPGTWVGRPATRFALLEATSTIGAPSPWLTQRWTETRAGLLRALDA